MKMIATGKKSTGTTERANTPGEGIIAARRVQDASTSDEWLLATHGRTFHFAARFLSSKQRSQVFTLYAFFRTLDDLVDIPAGRQLEDIGAELDAWKRWFARGSSFPAPREPLGSRLAAILDEHPVPITVFLDFLDGLRTDLEPRELGDFRELYRYCYAVAGTVGLAMAQVMGVNSSQALVAAQSLGIAMQLTNILRDVGGDLAAGRVYIPQEDLERFDSSRLHLTRLYRDGRGPDDRFRTLMRYQITRAHHYYGRGMSGIWLLPRHCRLPILIAGRLYRRILTAIERNDYDVLRRRAATSMSEKVHEAAIAFALDRLWHRGEESLSPGMEVILED